VRDLVLGKTVWASTNAVGLLMSITNLSLTNATGRLSTFCDNPVISDDGRYVAFKASGAFGPTLILRHNLRTGTTELVSRNVTASSLTVSDDFGPEMSADGRFITFTEAAPLPNESSVWGGTGKLRRTLLSASI
jgi:Tol biopolymer transport system component